MNLKESTRVMITGCGGMLGKAVYERFGRDCTVLASDIDLNEPWLERCDVRDLADVLTMAREFKPELLINLAALTDLEYCELNEEDSWLTNGLGQENVCTAAKQLGIPVVYVSTAGIFDGAKEYYNDFDLPNPLSVYAKSKYHGELVTPALLSRYFIFRAGWMMGGGPEKDKKFINKIFKQLRDGADELFVVDDKLGTPTYTVDFANSMFELVKSDLYGLYNMVCEGSGSRFDVATEFVRCLGLQDKVKLTVVGSDYFKNDYFAPRPASEKLVNMKLKKRGMMFMRDWRECLAEYSRVFTSALA